MSGENQKTGKTFIGVSIVIFISKILGFIRDVVFASIFGTTVITDAFQAIFSLPSLLFSSVGTALSSVNIPDLTYHIKNKTREERNHYLSNLFAHITLWATLLSVLGIIFAPTLAKLIAPGLDDQIMDVAILLTRIMVPTLLFVSLTYVAAGVLQVHGHFTISAMISIPFNILIILALIFKGADIIFLGYVTTIGWFLQFLIQLPLIIKEKYRFKFGIDFRNEHTVNIFKQLIPILMGNSLLQLCLIMDRSFGTHLDAGTTAALAFGSNLFVTITSIFIVAMSTVVFPKLSKYCLEDDLAQVRALLNTIFKILLFILLPYLLIVIIYHQEIISLVYERGAFTSESTDITSTAFLFYSFAVVGYACQEIFNRVYYAMKKFKVPMKVSLFCLSLNFLLNYYLYESHGIMGISASTAACLILYASIMSVLLYRDIGGFMRRDFFTFALKLLLPATAMMAVIFTFKYYAFTGLIMGFLLPLCLSGIVYLAVAHFSGVTRVFILREESI